MNELQHVPKLPGAPLQEVVFEARWELDGDEQTGLNVDSGYEFALGKLHERLADTFPHHQNRFPGNVPSQLLTGQIVHQFWTARETFPLVQFGPGVVTVNQNGVNYEWESQFLPLIRQVMEHVISSYRGDLRLSTVKLFYIDAIELNDATDDLLERLDRLKLKMEFNVRDASDLVNVGVNLVYGLEHESTLRLSIQNAVNTATSAPALLWNTAVQSDTCQAWNDDDVVDSVMTWCAFAHSETSRLFKNMTEGPLYDSFLQRG